MPRSKSKDEYNAWTAEVLWMMMTSVLRVDTQSIRSEIDFACQTEYEEPSAVLESFFPVHVLQMSGLKHAESECHNHTSSPCLPFLCELP